MIIQSPPSFGLSRRGSQHEQLADSYSMPARGYRLEGISRRPDSVPREYIDALIPWEPD